MKKQVIYASAVAAAILVGFTGAAISTETSVRADDNVATSEEAKTPLTVSDNLATTSGTEFSKNETVYAIADANGAIKSTYIGSTIYSGDEKLPVAINVRCYLDGKEVSAAEIAGKTGRVKIVFKYDSLAARMGKKVPFVAVTGLTLDGAKFSNVKVTNGRIVNEDKDFMIAGYGLPGMNEDLATSLLPEEFTIEADTTGFTLGTTYTVLMNDLIGDLDTSGLSEVDGLTNSMNQLAAGMDQLVNGAQSLASGATSVYENMKKVQASASELATKMGELANGAEKLSNGMNALVDFNTDIVTKIDGVTGEVTEIIQDLVEKYGKYVPSEYLEKMNAMATKYYDIARTSVATYTGNIEALATGANGLATGAGALTDGAWRLANGMGSLANGAGQLANGSNTLYGGLVTFKASGIDKLVNFANNDLSNFTRNLRDTVTAAGMYHNFGGADKAETVRFIIKTASVK